MIRVKNKRRSVAPEYRPSAPIKFYVGRPSILGNPFEIGKDGTREEVIRKDRAWLLGQIEKKTTAGRTLTKVRSVIEDQPGSDVDLVCWCAPNPCHADEIKAVLDRWPDE